MAERMTQSWTTVPHFYLVREVNASRLIAWRERAAKKTGARSRTRICSSSWWRRRCASTRACACRGRTARLAQHEINVGLAVAIDDGLVVPVIHRADTLSLTEIAAHREEVVTRAQSGQASPCRHHGRRLHDLEPRHVRRRRVQRHREPAPGGDPRGRTHRGSRGAVDGQPAVQPIMVLTLSCDHRAVDGARGAQFLGALADLVEEPLTLLV